MPVPPVSRFLGPTLRALSDGQTRSVDDLINIVAWHFDLSEADRRLRTGGGTNTQLRDRVNWTITYLVKAGLVTRPQPRYVRITERGQQANQELDPGQEIDVAHLMRFPEFAAWKGSRERSSDDDDARADSTSKIDVPVARLEGTGRVGTSSPSLPDQLADHLLRFVAGLDAMAFRQLVGSFLGVSGFRAAGPHRDFFQSVGPSGDAAGVVSVDALGLVRILVHAIRSEKVTPSGTVHRFVRDMSMERCRFGILITQHEFAPDARDALALMEKDVVLIDGHELARRLVDRTLGCSTDCRSLLAG